MEPGFDFLPYVAVPAYFGKQRSVLGPIFSLHSKYFKVVQGHMLLVHQRTRDPLAIVGFLVFYFRLSDMSRIVIEFGPMYDGLH